MGEKISNTDSHKAELELLWFILKLNVLAFHVNDEQLSPSDTPYFSETTKNLKDEFLHKQLISLIQNTSLS